MPHTRTHSIAAFVSLFVALDAACGGAPPPRDPATAATRGARGDAAGHAVAEGDEAQARGATPSARDVVVDKPREGVIGAVAPLPTKAQTPKVEAAAASPSPIELGADAKFAALEGASEGDSVPAAGPPVTRATRVRAMDDLLESALQAPSSGLTVHGVGRGAGGVSYGTIGQGSLRMAGGALVRHGYASPLQLAQPAGPLAHVPTDFDTEAYAHIAENPFRQVSDTPLSTFSLDVDTASYSNVRRFLRDGQRPPIDAVRIEELVNYFRYDDPAPSGDQPFAVHTEVASAPWNPRHRLVRIGVRGREIAAAAVPPRNLVFLVDVSGSMEGADKLPLLKHGLAMLARSLRPQDHIAIVVYAGASGLALPTTRGDRQGAILAALGSLEAGGSTNGAEGIELAYELAQEGFVPGGINRVILATDGDFNVGVTSEGELVRLIEKKRESGVFLTVLGFGSGNVKDSTMEALADHGNGNYAYVDSPAEARKVLVREAGSTLVTIAKDVKLQVEFNPARVASYRLIGYENRALADRDFNDDKKDAGDVGAGHCVTALYELTLARDAGDGAPEVDPLRYQTDRAPSAVAGTDELMTVKVRYKAPNGDSSRLSRYAVRDTDARLDATSDDFRWSTAVAGFGMLLRDSAHKGNASMDLVLRLARSAVGRDAHGDRRELLDLVERARRLGIDG